MMQKKYLILKKYFGNYHIIIIRNINIIKGNLLLNIQMSVPIKTVCEHCNNFSVPTSSVLMLPFLYN